MDAAWCETTTPSFPRKRESSLSNSLRVADKAVFAVLSHCVRVFLLVWIPAFAGMTVALMMYVMNYVKVNNSILIMVRPKYIGISAYCFLTGMLKHCAPGRRKKTNRRFETSGGKMDTLVLASNSAQSQIN